MGTIITEDRVYTTCTDSALCHYKPIKISLWKIKRMIKKGVWEDSLEEEEVMYNIANHNYPKRYTNKLYKIINKECSRRFNFNHSLLYNEILFS